MSYLIKFYDVGRTKACFEVRVESLDEQTLRRVIRKRGVLMGHCIDVCFDDGGQAGILLVGGFRNVGRFEVVNLNEKALSV